MVMWVKLERQKNAFRSLVMEPLESYAWKTEEEIAWVEVRWISDRS
jgi:hypothetical protein